MATGSLQSGIVGDLFKFFTGVFYERRERPLVSLGTAPFHVLVTIACQTFHCLFWFLGDLVPKHIGLKAKRHIDAFSIRHGKNGSWNRSKKSGSGEPGSGIA